MTDNNSYRASCVLTRCAGERDEREEGVCVRVCVRVKGTGRQAGVVRVWCGCPGGGDAPQFFGAVQPLI